MTKQKAHGGAQAQATLSHQTHVTVTVVEADPVLLLVSVTSSEVLHVAFVVMLVVSMPKEVPGPTDSTGEVPLRVLAEAPGHCTVHRYLRLG